VHYGKSVRPRRSLVGSPRFESRTPFHGWATSSEGRRAVATVDGRLAASGATVLPRSHPHSSLAQKRTTDKLLNRLNIINNKSALREKRVNVRWPRTASINVIEKKRDRQTADRQTPDRRFMLTAIDTILYKP